jgi:hypothetical protein
VIAATAESGASGVAVVGAAAGDTAGVVPAGKASDVNQAARQEFRWARRAAQPNCPRAHP